MTAINEQPIFVVGVPRSGTTLLATILARHGRLYCGPETFFFNHWARAARHEILSRRSWPQSGAAFLQSLTLEGRKLCDILDISEADLLRELEDRPPCAAALCEAFMTPQLRKSGKARWVEKTPDHILFVEEIRALYPAAPIIRVVRDPRAVALSLQRVPWGSRSLIANLYKIQNIDDRSRRFFERDARSMTVRYEDLLHQPEENARRVCDFVNESYDPSLLAPHNSDRALFLKSEWWKLKAVENIDPSRADDWRKTFPAELAVAAETICARVLKIVIIIHCPWKAARQKCPWT